MCSRSSRRYVVNAKAAFAAISRAWVVSDLRSMSVISCGAQSKGGAVVRALLTIAPAEVSALTGGNVRALTCSFQTRRAAVHKLRLDIGQPEIIGPAIATDGNRVAAASCDRIVGDRTISRSAERWVGPALKRLGGFAGASKRQALHRVIAGSSSERHWQAV